MDTFVNNIIFNNDITHLPTIINLLLTGKKTLSRYKLLKKLLVYFNSKYLQGSPVVNDSIYDIIYNIFHEFCNYLNLNEEDELDKINIESNKYKTKLPIPLPSLKKVFNFNDFLKWRFNYFDDTEVIITPKYDGISILYDLITNSVYSKGTDNYGIKFINPNYLTSFNFKTINNIKYIRGELILPKNKFINEIKELYTTPRNYISAIINSNRKFIETPDFIAYEVIDPILNNYIDELNVLSKFTTATTYITTTMDNCNFDNIINWLNEFKEKIPYEIDGIVFRVNSNIEKVIIKTPPKYTLAFKEKSPIFDTEITDIIWVLSRMGKYKPIIYYKPIEYHNKTYIKASGKNYNFIISNQIGVGSIIKIVFSGEIPNIISVIATSKKYNLPKSYKVVLPDIYTSNEFDINVISKQISYFLRYLHITSGIQTIKRFYNLFNVTSFVDFLIKIKENDVRIYNELFTKEYFFIDILKALNPTDKSYIEKIYYSNQITPKFENILKKYNEIKSDFESVIHVIHDKY